MKFKVYLMRRGGRKLSWRDTINSPAFVGELSLGSVSGKNCVYKIADLFSQGALATRLLPPLYEPVVISIAPLAMQLRGFERMKEPEGYYSVIQEWHCEAVHGQK